MRKTIYFSSDSDDEIEESKQNQNTVQISQKSEDLIKSQRLSMDIKLTNSINFQQDQQVIGSFYQNSNKLINNQCDQLIVFLGANDEFKQQNLSFLTGDHMYQSSQPILALENQPLNLISYPIKDDLDLQKKMSLWYQINTQLKDKQIIFTLTLDKKQLIQSKESLKIYLYNQLQVLESSVSDVDLLIQLKFLTVIVSFVVRQQKNIKEDVLFNNEMKLLKEKIYQIYWEEQSINTFRAFLYYLIQLFSSEDRYFQLHLDQQSKEQLLSQLRQQQSIDSEELTIKPPEDVLNQMTSQCIEEIMNLELEKHNFNQFYELFCSLPKQKNKLQEIYSKRIQKSQQIVQDMIQQIKQNQGQLNQYTILLNYIKNLENFEQHLSSLNLTKLVKCNDFVESIQEAFELHSANLNLNEIKDFIIILSSFSDWNNKFQLQEINIKQKIGCQLNQILSDLINKSERESFSQTITNLQEIVDILTNSNKQNIQEFFTQSKIQEIKNQLKEIFSTCCKNFDCKLSILQNQHPNFKSILENLQYCLQLIQVLNVFRGKQQLLEDIIGIDFNKSVEECEEKLKKLKTQLEKIKQQLDKNDSLSIIVLKEKDSVKQVYQILDIQVQIDEQNMQSSLNKSVQEQKNALNDLISKKLFGEEFVSRFIELEKYERSLSNNLEVTREIQKKFKEYFSNFLELYKKINSDDIDFRIKTSLRAEKTKLDNLKQLMRIKNEPKYLIDMLNNLPQNNPK